MELSKERLLNGLNRQILVEETFSDLANLSDTPRIDRSKKVIVHYQRVYQDGDGQAVTEWNIPSTSGDGSYTCDVRISVPGTLFGLAKQKWDAKRFASAFASADVKVYCSCPDFYWGGQKYNLGPNGSVRGGKLTGNHTIPKSHGYKHEKDVVTYAPNVRDPNREHVLCKHLLGVFARFKSNAFDIMRDARRAEVDIPENSADINQATKKGVKVLMKDDAKRQKVSENLRKGLTEGFVQEVTQLHKDQKLPEEEGNDIVEDVVQTNPPEEVEVEADVDNVIPEAQPEEVEVKPEEVVPSEEPEITEGFDEIEEETTQPEELNKDSDENDIDPNSILKG